MQVEVSDGSVRLSVGFDNCPAVILRASPSTTRIGDPIDVSAVASDDDRADHLTYLWTAARGSFASATGSDTTYVCPDTRGAGPQDVTVAVSDGSCTVTRTVTLSCLATSDAGSLGQADGNDAGGSAGTGPGSGADGGMAGSPGTGGVGDAGVVCAGDPSTCEGQLCNQCTFGVPAGDKDLCSDSASMCFNCNAETDGCAHYASDAERTKCYAVYTCLRDSGCVGANGEPTACWCGTIAIAACQSGTAPANGPCVAPILDGAGTTEQSVVFGRLSDPNYPVGGAWNLAGCRSAFCGRQADPDHPACPLW